jgi:hypothetical protein
MNSIHQINETHIGDTCTPDEAREVARNLTRLGYPSEYNAASGVASYLVDDDGEQIEIPQSVWDEALSTLLSDIRHS